MSPVPRLDNEAVEAVEDLIDALVSAGTEIRHTEQSLRVALKRVSGGEELESVLAMVQPAGLRQALNDALEVVNQRRHAARLKVFELALERGHTIADLGRAWGISRQLASRYVREGTDAHQQKKGESADEG
jgi:DNA-directed RNA polymerase sigma subunit (sigma70/sigma32)